MMTPETTFTPSEAALVSGVPIQAVHKAIDEGPLESARGRKSRRRTLTELDLLYLAAASIFDPRLMQLTDQAKELLRRAIAAHCRTEKPTGKLMVFKGLEVDIRLVFSRVRSKAALLDRAKKMVTTNPHIRGGEPVIRGTRIGVYEVAAMVAGASEKEIEDFLAGHPTLKREHLELARIYTAAHPRRGRPPKHPWHNTGAPAPT
jgi:uncharacterized protein (DUF433 family)